MQFDSLADVISFGMAPAILSFPWGLAPLGRLGWAAGFLFVAAAAMRLARFNIQSAARRRQAVLRRHAEPGGGRRAGRDRVRVSRGDLHDYRAALPALAMVLVPAVLMVSTIRFRSFKTIDLQSRRPYTVLLLMAAGIMLIATHPRFVLVVMAYTYLASAFIGLAVSRLRHRSGKGASGPGGDTAAPALPSRDSAAR